MAPASNAWRRASRRRPKTAAVKLSVPLSTPSTLRRRAECPTIAPKLRAGLAASTAPRYWPKVFQFQGTPSWSAPRGMPFDAGQQSHHVVGVDLVQRGYGKAAVAGHHGRHAMEGRRREEGIPEDLSVEVRVHVDESGTQHQSCSIDMPPGRRAAHRIAHPQSPAFDPDRADRGVPAGAVNDGRALDQHIEHWPTLPSLALRGPGFSVRCRTAAGRNRRSRWRAGIGSPQTPRVRIRRSSSPPPAWTRERSNRRAGNRSRT